MSTPDSHSRPLRLGQYLYMLGIITEAQLAAALNEQARRIRTGQPTALGDLLVEQGALSPQLLVRALMLQHLDRLKTPSAAVPALGELLIRAGLITAEQLATALTIQTERRQQGEHMLLGQILILQGALTPFQLEAAVRAQADQRVGAHEQTEPATPS
jgi:hypothetical protein